MDAGTSQVARAKRKRRWFQYSLRTLLILTTLAAVAAGWLGRRIERKRKERDAVAGIESLGGSVWYDYQQGPSSGPARPAWMRGLLGNDFFGEIVRARLVGDTIGDAGLTHVKALAQLRALELRGAYVNEIGLANLQALADLESLDLGTTNVTDAELANVKDLVRLQSLDLSSTNVTDGGLAFLKGLRQLRLLKLKHTNVTSAGVNALRNALPDCQVEC